MSGEGLYGLECFPVLPGQGSVVTLGDGSQELAPTQISTPTMRWLDVLKEAARLTRDRQEA
jgi:hypothetical protein